jgi:hypothetical protein
MFLMVINQASEQLEKSSAGADSYSIPAQMSNVRSVKQEMSHRKQDDVAPAFLSRGLPKRSASTLRAGLSVFFTYNKTAEVEHSFHGKPKNSHFCLLSLNQAFNRLWVEPGVTH